MTNITKSHPAQIWRKITIGLFHLMIVVTPFVFTWVNEELFEFNKLIAVYAFAIAITISYITRSILAGKIIFRKTSLDIPIAIFLITQLISTFLSIHPYTSVMGYYTRFHGGLLSYMTYTWLFYIFVNTFTKKDLKPLLISILIAGFGVALYALPEHFGHSPSCLFISGGTLTDTSCWVQDVQSRVFGTFGQPNWLAAQTIIMVALGLGALAQKYTQKLKLMISGVVVLNFLVLIYTKSRSGMLGLIVGLGVLTVLLAWNYWRNWKKDSNELEIPKILLSTLAAIIVIAFLTGTEFTPSIQKLISNNSSPTQVVQDAPAVNRLDIGGTDSGEIRQIVWRGAIAIWQRYPWFGSGPETFAYSYYLDRPQAHNLVSEWDFLYNKAHNEFLNFLATTGLFGLAGYLILIGSMLAIAVLPILKNTTKNAGILAGVTAGMIGLHVSNALGFSTVYVTLLMFILAAFVVVLNQKQSEVQKLSPVNTDSYFLIFGTWFIGLIGIFSVYSFWKADFLYSQAKTLDKMGEYTTSAQYLDLAIQKFPHEAEYQDQMSLTLTKLAITLAQDNQATLAGQIAQQALVHSDKAIQLNPAHLNIYRTRGSIFTYLGSINPIYLAEADKVIETATHLAPTDPKLVYNRGLIFIQLEDYPKAIEFLQKAIQMKPNYESARTKLAETYLKIDEPEKALEQYKFIFENIANKPELEAQIKELESQLEQ